MPVPVRRPAAAAVALLVVLAASAEAAGVVLRVDAGLAGVARPGRWMAVTVTIENTGAAAAGDLVVEMEGARAVRAIELPAPSRKRVEMFLRVPSSADPFVTVRFGSLEPVQVALRVAGDDAPVRVCIGALAAAGEAECTATLDVAAAPVGWRAYDAADDVRVADIAALSAAQRTAYERWRAMRHWSNAVNMAPVARQALPAAGESAARTALAVYVLLLVLFAAAAPRVRLSGTRALVLLVAVVLGASGAVLADGRYGRGAAVVVRDATVIRSGVGFNGAALLARGTVWFPSAGGHQLRAAFGDGAIDTRDPAFRGTVDTGGSAVLEGAAVKSQRIAFEVDGFIDAAFVSASAQDGRVALTNVSAFALTDCSLPEGYAPRTIARWPAGATIAVAPHAGTQEPVLACAIDGLPDTLAAASSSVEHRGTATLLYDLTPIGQRR
jgi:hypothetical protein